MSLAIKTPNSGTDQNTALNSGALNNLETPRSEQLEQQIATLAYALWEQRGQPVGSAEEDWIEAERQLANGKTVAAGAGR